MVDPIILYSYDEISFTSNGLGFLNDASACTVEEERNGIFELELEYPTNGAHYSDIQIRNIILAKPNPYDEPEPFRIYSISKPINGIITVNARHISYDLADWVCLPFICLNSKGKTVEKDGELIPYAGVTQYFQSEHDTFQTYDADNKVVRTAHGAIYDPGSTKSFPFTITTDMDLDFLWDDPEGKQDPIDDKRFKVLRPVSARSLLGDSSDYGILKKFYSIDPVTNKKSKGEIQYNKFNIHIADPNGLNPRGTNRHFEIRYGKNMTDVERTETADTDYTAVFPYWKSVQSENTEIKILDDMPGTYPDRTVPISGSSSRYRKFLIRDLSSDFEEEPTSESMRKYAREYIADEGLDGLGTTTISVNFQVLSKSSEYSKYAELEKVKLCDTVTVIHEGLEIEDEKKVIKTIYNVISGAYSSIDIGDPREELADTVSGINTNINTNIDMTSIIKETVSNVANEIPGLNTAINVAQTVANAAAKVVHQIYYLSTTGDLPSTRVTEWITNDNGAAVNEWITVEPDGESNGVVYQALQTKLGDNTITIDNPIVLKAITATKKVITEVKDAAGNIIGGIVDGGSVAEDSIDTKQLAPSSVQTDILDDEAVTREKIDVNAIHSGNYVDAYDEAAEWNSTKTYEYGDRVYYPGDDEIISGLYECTSYDSTSGSFNLDDWEELPSESFSISGSKFDLSEGYISSKNFAVDSSGNAFIRGNINATSGEIGGWSISDSELKTITSQNTIEFSGEANLYVDSTSPIGKDASNIVMRISRTSSALDDSAIFAIGSDGKIYSTAGYLGGWEISTDGIVNTTSDDKNVYLFGKNDASHTFSSSSPIGSHLEDDDEIPTNLVMRIGSASDATFALSANGVIYATSGYLGPLRLTNDGLQYTSEGEAGSAKTSTTALKANELFIRDEAVTSSWGANTADYFRVAKSVANNRDGFIFETRVTDGDSTDKAWIRMNYDYANGKEYAGYLGGIWNVNNNLIDISQPDYTKNVYINTLDDTRTYLSDDDERTIGQRLRAAESGAGKDFTLSYDGSTRKMSLNADGTSISEAEINLANASTSMDGLLDHHDKLKLNNLPTLMLTYEEV